MHERDAQRVAFVRAFEEADPDGALLRLEEREEATERAREAADAERRAALRAEILLGRLEREVPHAGRALALSRVGLGIVPVAMAAAFATGLASNALGPSQHVNLLSFPLLGLLVWNACVYAALAVEAVLAGRHARRRAQGRGEGAPRPGSRVERPARWRGLLGALLAWLAEWALQRMGPREARLAEVSSRALLRYWRGWAAASAPLAAARLRLALHLGATSLALGTVLGMYLRGLTLAYRVSWESTFLDAGQVAALLHLVLGPAASLLGERLPDANALAALRAPGGSAGAATWIHLWAVTTALFVMVPRLALAAAAWRSQARLARAVPVDPLAGSFRALLPPDRGAGERVRVIPYGVPLEARAGDRLRELLHELVGLAAEVTLAEAVGYGAEAEEVAAGAAGRFVVVFSSVQSPEREVHGRFVAELARSAGATGLLALVDGSAWSARLGGDADDPRRRERRRAWQRVLEEAGAAVLHVDLDRPLGEDAAARAEKALAAAAAGRRGGRPWRS